MASATVRSSLLQRFRQRIGPQLNRLAETFGRQTTHVYPDGYVATVHRPIDEVEAALRADGFAWDPLSAYHFTLAGESSDGSWVYRSSWLGDRQLHVVLFARGSDRTDVYSHSEFNWLRHPISHAREEGIRRTEGAAAMRDWLAERGLESNRQSTARRRIGHAMERLREAVAARSPDRPSA